MDLLNRAGDEAAARLQGARQTLELSLKKAEESLPHLASESASLLESEAAEKSASYREQLRASLAGDAGAADERDGERNPSHLRGAAGIPAR